MQKLIDKINDIGVMLPGGVLKVDGFLNHQLDMNLLFEAAKEFSGFFNNKKITKILTCEASGIAVAAMVGFVMDKPVVFCKKTLPSSMKNDEVYKCKVHSFTKDTDSDIIVQKRFLSSDDSVLVIDDFMAMGGAVKGIIEIVRQAKAELSGVGVVIEKTFQPGGKMLRDEGIDLKSLCYVSLDNKGKMVLSSTL